MRLRGKRVVSLPACIVAVWPIAFVCGLLADAPGPASREATGGLTVNQGVLFKAGRPWRGIGVNYFNAFSRHLADANNTSYEKGFAQLAEANIPFVRLAGCGFWPRDQKLYFDNPEEFFRRFDDVVRSAEKHGIGLIPSLFWLTSTVPDLVGEDVRQWGNPRSKTHEHMRKYVRDVVTRYRNSPALWGWEFGNEYNLAADLPNAAQHRPAAVPKLGTPATRSSRDELTHEDIRTAFAAFASEVRLHDPHRVISTGNSLPRTSAWHNWKQRKWTPDTPEQFAEMLAENSPEAVNLVCIHAYRNEFARLRQAAEIARKLGKPLFVGEFGSAGAKEKSQAEFQKFLDAIEESQTPLAAVWVFDYKAQDADWNITPTNDRAYQLQAIIAANARIAARGQ